MLRKTLLFFGWAIPFLVLLNIGVNLYMAASFESYRAVTGGNSVWLTIRSVLQGFDSLALSPLCFFGAHMLKKNTMS